MIIRYFVLTVVALYLPVGQPYGPVSIKELNNAVDVMKNFDQSAADRYKQKVLKPALKLLYSEENRLDSCRYPVAENANNTCREDMIAYCQDLQSDDPPMYALQMFDSDGVPSSGFLEGNWRWPGRYYECRRQKKQINVTVAGGGFELQTQFKGKWCNSIYGYKDVPKAFTWPYDIQVGHCIPDSCTTEQFHEIVTAFADYYHPSWPGTKWPFGGEKGLISVNCPELDTTLYTPEIIGIAISAIILCLVLMGTAKEALLIRKSPTPQDRIENSKKLSTKGKMLLSFSAISNVEKLMDASQKPGMIPCLDGIRVFSTLWVIFGHTAYFLGSSLDNLGTYGEMRKDPANMVLFNFTFCVDSFFVLGGFLSTYLFLKQLKKSNGRRHWWDYIVIYTNRYIRLTPVYAYLILFSMGLWKYFGSGPYYSGKADELYQNCQANWWSNLLYINNIYPVSKSCLGWAWYLANDMQFYICMPFFTLLLYHFPRTGISAAVLVISGSISFDATISAINNIQPDAFYWVVNFWPWLRFYYWPGANDDYSPPTVAYNATHDIYYLPWARVHAYMIGVIAGYIMFKCKLKVKMNKIVVFFGWIIAFGGALGIVYGIYPWVKDMIEIQSDVGRGFYAGLARPGFAACVAWMIIACISGYGGYIARFLNLSCWRVLAKLTYSAYIVHLLVIFAFYSSQDRPLHFTIYNFVYWFLGHTVISFMIAAVLVVTIEMPFSNAIRTWLVYLTLKVKGKPASPSAVTKVENDAKNKNDAVVGSYLNVKDEITPCTSKSSSSNQSSLSKRSDPPPYSLDNDGKDGKDNKAFKATEL